MTSLSRRLRQKLLDLAIRGKLVPQDAHDEPASELLERIRNDELGMRNGRARRAATAEPISDDEKPFDLPKGWCWCRLGEIAYVATGKTPSKTDFVDDGVPYLKMYNLRKQKIDFAFKRQYVKREVHEGQLARSRLAPGDLLMNIVGPPLGKLAIIPESLPEANFNQAAVMIRSYCEIATVNRYLFYYLSQMDEINSIDTKGTAGQDNISLTQAQRMRIALPPLAEQKRIVAALDGMLAAADAVAVGMDKIAALKEKVRAKILDLAIRGKLVKQEKDDEPADVLLARIRRGEMPAALTQRAQSSQRGAESSDRINRIYRIGSEGVEASLRSSAPFAFSASVPAGRKRNPVNPVNPVKKLPPITDDEKPFDLPKGWAWCRLGEIFDHHNGKQLNSSDKAGELRQYLTTSNVYWDRLELNTLKSMLFTEEEYVRCSATKGDLLVCEGGDIGRAAIWNNDYDVGLQNHIHRLRASGEIVARFFLFVFWAYKIQGRIQGKGIAIQGLSAKTLHNMPIPLPPLAEQKRIVAKVDEMLAACEKLGMMN